MPQCSALAPPPLPARDLIPTVFKVPTKGNLLPSTPLPTGQGICADNLRLHNGNGYDHNFVLSHAADTQADNQLPHAATQTDNNITCSTTQAPRGLPMLPHYRYHLTEVSQVHKVATFLAFARCGFC